MTALILSALLAFQDDAAAASAVSAFDKQWLKDKSSDARVAAVGELAKVQHAKVADKLGSLLTSEDKQVRSAAAAGLGTFTSSPELKKAAAKHLSSGLSAGANSNDPDIKIAILAALGALQEESTDKKVKDYFEDKDHKIASAAVTAAGQLKAKSMVDPLIQVLRECEETIKKATTPGSVTQQKLGQRDTARKAAPGVGKDPERDKKDRANALVGPSLTALATLTGQNLKTSDEYEKWWTKNRSTFNPQK